MQKCAVKLMKSFPKKSRRVSAYTVYNAIS